ncbi:FecR family protein [Sphingobacterium faecium]|jgi:transmembrane sensor|uniref:FecR family protein n=1 Tax=Sphingobacterium faecium TaxID=34087 RepID=UPI0021B63B01|nr:FecR family protein [Sphingobacterium faecium]UXD69749.1 FecR family protein [Sphingobacterium faecium]WGQ13297.1 FecR family protein [Sphingobacterium faecium]
MRSKPFIIAKIIKKSLVEELTGDEMAMLEFWINSKDENKQLYDNFKKSYYIEEDLTIINRIDLNQAWNTLEKKGKELKNSNHGWNLKIWIPLIASCLVLCFFFLYQNKTINNSKIIAIQSSKHKNDVKPASNDAVLILDNGESFDLSNRSNKQIANNITLRNDQLEYVKGKYEGGQPKYNTLVVPKGGYYKLELSDGTKVWINAMSRLKFPESFGSGERKVQLEGEAYFEVSKDPDRPFIVQASGTDVKVLGTHFNVDAYNKKVRTTLEEGKVEVSTADHAIILQPGDFAESGDGKLNKGRADLAKDLAWHNNEFYFNKDNVQSIVDQLSNWYAIEAKFDQGINRNKVITGSIDRNVPLSQVLEMLEYVSDLRFKIDGNQLIIKNK